MTSKARILIVSSDTGRSSIWSAIVRGLVYDTIMVDPTTALAQAHLARADCALVEAGIHTAHLRSLLHGTEAMPAVPVVLLEPRLADALDAGDAERTDDVIVRHIRRRIESMVRLRTMADEWRRRHAAYAALGNEPDLPADAGELAARRDTTLLVAGAPSADYPVIESAFADEHTVIVAAFTPLMTVDYLSRHSFDALVLSTGDEAEVFMPVVSALRRNPRLVETPVVLLSPRHGLKDPLVALGRGVSDILTPPLSAARDWNGEADWIGRIRTFLTESVTRKALREALRSLPPESFCDPASGLPGRAAFEAYLTRLLSDQRNPARCWALCVVTWPRALGVNHAAFHRMAGLVNSLTRAEDFCAQIGPSEIAVALPNTTMANAAAATKRLRTALIASLAGGGFGQDTSPAPSLCVLDGRSAKTARDLISSTLEGVRGRMTA